MQVYFTSREQNLFYYSLRIAVPTNIVLHQSLHGAVKFSKKPKSQCNHKNFNICIIYRSRESTVGLFNTIFAVV